MNTLLQDLRYAVRTLRRSPGFAAVAVLTLALGIGANASVFALVNAVLLRPPAHVVEPERLVALFTSDFSGPAYGSSSYADLRDFEAAGVFSGIAAYAPRPVGLGQGDEPERAGMELVSADYFRVLGVRPARGRFFVPEEAARPGGPAAVVISHALWQRRFAGAPDVAGRTLHLDGRPFTVVGVAPEGFTGSLRGIGFDLWVPLVAAPPVGMGPADLSNRGNRTLMALARLRPGVSLAQAESRMRLLSRQLRTAHPDEWTDVNQMVRRITVLPESQARLPPQVSGVAVGFLALLMGTVAVVLLVCCANVAGLMLARAAGRMREVGIRVSLGATRRRLAAQLLTESLVLAALGAALGTLGALWATDLFTAFQPPLPFRLVLDLRPDVRVMAFTAAVSVGTVLLFGLAPALRASRPDPALLLRDAAPVAAVGRRRLSLRGALVVGQVAMSLLLLSGALLFLRTLRGAASIDPGFRAEGVLLAVAEPRPGPEEEDAAGRARVSAELRDRVAALPGVREATWAATVPLGIEASRRGISVEGYRVRSGEDMEFHFNMVGPRYFETLEIAVLLGRGITAGDRAGAPGAVVVNESFARRFWPGGDPLRGRISVSGPGGPWLQVVGVARDGRYASLTEEPRPFVYFSALQEPWGTTLHVRAGGEPRALLPTVRRVLRETAPGWTLRDAGTLEEHVSASLLPQRVAAGAMGLFAGLAVLLSAVGLYGVVALAVAGRTREIGVRMALGARGADVVRLVLRQGLGLAAAGVVVGLPLAWGALRLVSTLLLGRGGTDWAALAAAPLLLVLVALGAAWLPARRAVRIDPISALRAE